jgi:prophage antirepressor-like protein
MDCTAKGSKKRHPIVPFDFEGSAVRVATRDGEPWWVLTDVCRPLEIGHAPMASQRLDYDEKDTISLPDSEGRPHQNAINELTSAA